MVSRTTGKSLRHLCLIYITCISYCWLRWFLGFLVDLLVCGVLTTSSSWSVTIIPAVGWEISKFSFQFCVQIKSTGFDLHAIDSLMTWSRELSSPCDPSSKFWCKHMPPDFGIKEILFQNYHVCVPDRSVVMGKEFWSRVYYLLPSVLVHETMLQNFYESIIASLALGFVLLG